MHIIILSIQSAVFPNLWKVAKVIRLYMKGEVYDPKNYRLVSLPPLLFKILESVIYCQINGYLQNNTLIHPSHHGF